MHAAVSIQQQPNSSGVSQCLSLRVHSLLAAVILVEDCTGQHRQLLTALWDTTTRCLAASLFGQHLHGKIACRGAG
jgi:hypothetical protein